MWPFRSKVRQEEERKCYLVAQGEQLPPIVMLGSTSEALVSSSSALFACVTANAAGVAGLPPVAQRRGSAAEGRWIDDESATIDEWVASPGMGAAAAWDWGMLVEHITLHLELSGRWFGKVITAEDGSRLLGIQPLDGTVVANRDKTGAITSYLHNRSLIPASSVLHIAKASPALASLGMSPAVAAEAAREVDYYARTRQVYALRNRAAPGMVVTVPDGLSSDPEEKKKQVDEFSEQYAGASKEGRPMLLGGNVKISEAPQFSPRGYLDLRKVSAEDIHAIYRTPPVVVGRGLDSSRYVESSRVWVNVALYPLLNRIYSAMNHQVIRPIYGPGWRVWYDVKQSQFALAIKGEQAELGALLIKEYGYPANLAARYVGLGLEYVPELDMPNVVFTIAGRSDVPPEK